MNSQSNQVEKNRHKIPLRKLLSVASIATGLQFGWAQSSLLTPYVQELGIPHAWASIIWLFGPLSGLLVQPLVGHLSDRCTSKFGRRRPFIIVEVVLIILAVVVIGHSADIGWLLGDKGESKSRAIVAFFIGFWLFDVANNSALGSCRALLADLSGKDHRRTQVAFSYFSMFLALGNVLGYATGAYSGLYKFFGLTITSTCAINCSNLKAAFYIDIVFTVLTSYICISAGQEQPLVSSHEYTPLPEDDPEQPRHTKETFLFEMFGTLRFLPAAVWMILLLMSLTMIGWYPFLFYNTDWMGREIYGGNPKEGENYSNGVRMGAFGLLLNSVVVGVTSVLTEKLCQKWGSGFIWGLSNIVMGLCYVSMIIVSLIVKNMEYGTGPTSSGFIIAALIIFAILGIPLGITYSVPFALISTQIESLGLGQGLSMGVLNLAIVIPRVIVSVVSGPWDQLFGGGNSPAFAVAAVSAFASGLVALFAMPKCFVKKPSHQ
ncbi:Sucrose transporter [Heracleum sosnowskyi]|uniref:Sucrose transporter n=1 Tax=Heracleum sosnowskyi TaxID=360622 RepID=A0AAD8HHZ0_9APIA|nr:Sucrose transporter [Heracleum sosnowskyi]